MPRAVAIDLGASSARFAIGSLIDGKIDFEIVEQIPHKPLAWNGHDVWDIDLLLGFCERALKFAQENGAESIGIDSWGVDHGFVDSSGKLIQPPICYRDASHQAMFEHMAEHRPWLYAQTGIQHQPFNTLYQLMARKGENPGLFEPGNEWLLLPDLLLSMLGGERGYERSIASTTQLTGAAGEWNPAVFERFELPLPALKICDAGIAGEREGVKLMRVAGHDTASAVLGMGTLGRGVFANIGTWALVGAIREYDASPENERANLTNERMSDGRVRLLTNIPGFYIVNRLHEDLGRSDSVGEWLESADLNGAARIDVFDSALYAPDSMIEAVSMQLDFPKLTHEGWAGLALLSLVDAIADRVQSLHGDRLRLTGGGSKSSILCRILAETTGVPVSVGPAEATILGNLALQFADGDSVKATELVDASLDLEAYA